MTTTIPEPDLYPQELGYCSGTCGEAADNSIDHYISEFVDGPLVDDWLQDYKITYEESARCDVNDSEVRERFINFTTERMRELFDARWTPKASELVDTKEKAPLG